MSEAPELKRLTGVPTAASSAVSVAARLYAAGKEYVPASLQPTVAAAETRVVTLASPYVAVLSDKSAATLQAVDSKLDSAIAAAWQSYSANSQYVAGQLAAQKAARTADLEQFAAARAAYLKRVEESVAFVREQGLQGTTKAAADALLARVEEARKVPEAAVSQISEAWAKFIHMPAVERLLAASRTQVEAAFGAYTAAHNTLVADPRYAHAVAKSGEILEGLKATSAYKAAAGRLSPLLAPYADTASKVAGPYVSALATHMAPVQAAA